MENNKNWKTVYLVVGGSIGLISGLAAAYIMVQRAEKTDTRPQLSSGEGVKISLGILGLLKLITDMGASNK